MGSDEPELLLASQLSWQGRENLKKNESKFNVVIMPLSHITCAHVYGSIMCYSIVWNNIIKNIKKVIYSRSMFSKCYCLVQFLGSFIYFFYL